jgi:hypothetical protein
MKEETAIMVNWVSNVIDCCCAGFLPCAFAVQGSVWDGILCQVVEDLCPLWLWLVRVHLSPAGIPVASSMMLLGLLAPTVGTAARSTLCCGNVLDNDVLVKLWREQILVPDTIPGGGGRMKEEMAIMVNWVSNGIDCCCAGFLPCAFAVQGSVWDGVLCQVVEVSGKDNSSKLCRAKWHQNKGFARVAVIGTLQVPFGAGDFPWKKDKGVKGVGKMEG